jgi:uncharacterized RDD family membrane protein YckC
MLEKKIGIGRYFGALVYESLVVIAICLAVAVILLPLQTFGVVNCPVSSAQLQVCQPIIILQRIFIPLALYLYFAGSWVRRGQTMPMRAWRFRVLTYQDNKLTWMRSAVRLVLAVMGIAFFGVTFFWAVFDRDGLFLHDRLAGTKLVSE